MLAYLESEEWGFAVWWLYWHKAHTPRGVKEAALRRSRGPVPLCAEFHELCTIVNNMDIEKSTRATKSVKIVGGFDDDPVHKTNGRL